MMLALPKPYGYPHGTPITLQSRGGCVNGDVVAGVVLGYGCPPFILPKVSSAMAASGRYDCRVTVSDRALDNLKHTLNAINIDLIVHDRTNLEPNSAKYLR